MAARRDVPVDRDPLTPSPTLLTFRDQPAVEALLCSVRAMLPEGAPPRRSLPATPLVTEASIAHKFRSVEAELERGSRIDPAFVPLPISDDSRSPSPVRHASPSSTLKRARDSGHFSRDEISLLQHVLEPPSTSRCESPRPVAHRYSSKLHPYDGVSEPFDTFIARFDNFASHYQWNEAERLFHLCNRLKISRKCLVGQW